MSSEQHQIKRKKKVPAKEVDDSNDETLKDESKIETRVKISDQAETESESKTDTSEEDTEQQLLKAQATIKDYWDQIMRLKAEIENNIKRASRDIGNAHKFALRNFAESLLPILDSMEMGQQAAEGEKANLSSIVEGSQLTMTMFVQALEKHGLKQIDPVGESFDPDQHQAISIVEDENAESNTVISVMQKGFSLNDRLVRPAMVVVAK
ncbi:protein GrpE [bacterium MnTg03]|nr:protein GrpE [bacterium MnTg03]